MHVHYVFGLLLIFLLSVSYCVTTTEEPDNVYWKKFDDDQDDYDDYNSEEIKLENNTNFNNYSNLINNNHITINLESTTVQTIPKSDLNNKLKETHLNARKCPDNCDCDEELIYINCSSRNYHFIPKLLPFSLVELDLSNNFIKQINKSDLDYLINLKTIFLNNNYIANLPENIFVDNKNLQTINLANNIISEIDPNIFRHVPSVSNLDVSNNAINLPKEGSFLNAPELETLILRNCSLNEIYDDSFRNMTGLIKLMLDQNDFNKKINTRAFNASLQNLVKLTLPELEQTYIFELCQILKSIDNISFKNFDLSCFEIVAGLSFNESLISSGTQIPLLNTNIDHKKDNNAQNNKGISINPTKISAARKPSKKTMNNTNVNENIEKTEEHVDEDKDIKTMQVSSEIINYCLFAIMGLAVIGLVIGIICRKDVYGIKTKLCRTKKTRGPVKTDQIRPREEIPLNKV